MKTNSHRKYIAIVLAIVFLIAAAFVALEIWENREGIFPGFGEDVGLVTYKGKEYLPKSNIDTYLVLGVDKYEGASTSDSHESGVQADFLLLLVFDNDTKQCSALHINRDTMASVNKLGIGGVKIDTYTKQLALAYNYVADNNDKVRCRNTKDAVEALLCNVDIEHYLSLTMDVVPVMNDLVGGVEVTVLDDFSGVDDTLVKGETVTLMGEHALNYVRSRFGLEDSTNATRMVRQQQYIQALYDKLSSCVAADDEFIVTLVDTVDDYVVYDSSDYKMQKLAEKFDEYEFLGIRELQGETRLGEEFLEFYPDEDSIWENVIDLFYTEK